MLSAPREDFFSAEISTQSEGFLEAGDELVASGSSWPEARNGHFHSLSNHITSVLEEEGGGIKGTLSFLGEEAPMTVCSLAGRGETTV